MSKESGKTCMKPVERMIPEAKDFTMRKGDFSGWKAGTDRAKNGRQTPIRLVMRIEKIAMSLRSNALSLSIHVLLDLDLQTLTD